jgi:hypothetical protein
MLKPAANRVILNLKPHSECVEGLRRYCAFFDVTITRFLERKIRLFERQLLERLTHKQRQRYLSNALTLADMSEAEQAAFNAPLSVDTAAITAQPGAAT